jgi:hypothetical protein
MVICAFKPKLGKQDELVKVVAKHWNVLKSLGLVTDREPYRMHATDGTIVEVFEWRSREAIEQAHQNPVVLALWAEFEAACDYIPIGAVPESAQMFCEFQPLA